MVGKILIMYNVSCLNYLCVYACLFVSVGLFVCKGVILLRHLLNSEPIPGILGKRQVHIHTLRPSIA